MQGTITPGTPLTNLPWRLAGFFFGADDEVLKAYINLYLTLDDRTQDKILCQRTYFIPLKDSPIVTQGQNLIAQVLAVAAQQDGQFALQVDAD